MKNMRAIQFIKAMKGQGLSEKGVEEILSIMDEKEGELATKADIERLEAGQKEQGKSNRWAIGLLATAIIGGLTLLGIIITYQISDMRADIRELRQSQQSEQPAERTGNAAKQEGRISAADRRGS